MIVRRCSQGHRVRVHKNTTPGATRTKTYTDGSTETLAYPSSYDYFVDVDGEVAKKSNSFKAEIQDFYDKRGVTYGLSETKAELLSRIVPMYSGDTEVSKHLKV